MTNSSDIINVEVKHDMILKKYNTILVKEEVTSLYIITNSIIKNKDGDIICLGFNNYLILLTLEITDYINNNYSTNINIKYKSKLKECRARIKPYQLEISEIFTKINKLNKETMNTYTQNLSKIAKILFSNLITNLGVFEYNNRIIANTFLIAKDLKPIIYKDNKPDKDKIIEISSTTGELLRTLTAIFNKKIPKINDVNLDFKEKFILKNYNVFKKHNEFFAKDIDINISLFLLDILSIINFCNEIIYRFNISESLKYRILYIAYYRTYHNLNTIFNTNTDKLNNLKLIHDKYKILNNRIFRNAMFHYDFSDKINETELDDTELYFGLIKKYFKINQFEYKILIKNYFNDISSAIESIIFN